MRLSVRIIAYLLFVLLGVGAAFNFVSAKDEEVKPVESKESAGSSTKESKEKESHVENGKEKQDGKQEGKSETKQEGKQESKADEKDGQSEKGESLHSKSRTPSCLASESAVEDIRRAREEIDKRQKALAAREADLKHREDAISEELKKLSNDRESIKKALQEQDRETQEKKAKLVETFLAMSPKAAAKVISSLDDSLAISVISQMDTPKLAKIMNLLDAKRSTLLSEKLVGLVRAKEAPALGAERSVSFDAAETKEKKEKGGEK